MGACSSKPNVLDDEGRVLMPQESAPVLEVDQGTNEVNLVENVVSAKEESYHETLEDESEEMPTKESPAVVEATLAAEEANNVETPVESEDSNKQVETPATDEESKSIEETETVEALADTNLPTEEAAQEVPATSGNENPFQSFMANVTKGWGWH